MHPNDDRCIAALAKAIKVVRAQLAEGTMVKKPKQWTLPLARVPENMKWPRGPRKRWVSVDGEERV